MLSLTVRPPVPTPDGAPPKARAALLACAPLPAAPGVPERETEVLEPARGSHGRGLLFKILFFPHKEKQEQFNLMYITSLTLTAFSSVLRTHVLQADIFSLKQKRGANTSSDL